MATDAFASRPWLLLPGTLCSGDVFEDFLDALNVPRSQRQVIALDRPHVADYAEICEKAGPETVVCGFSLGAIVAAHWADTMKARRLILFGINPYPDNPAKAQARHDLARDVALQGGAAAMQSRLPPLHGSDPDKTRAKILAMADQTAQRISPQTALALRRPGALGALSHGHTPVFALTGTNDTATPPAQGRAAAAAAPAGHFRLLDGLGHFALLEDPQACAIALAEMEARFRTIV